MKVYQLNTELYKVTGIQRVLRDIHEALRQDFDAKIVGTAPYGKVDATLQIPEEEYVKLRNPLMFRNSLVIVHERRLLPLLYLLSHIPGLNVKCLYVHHSLLYGNRKLSLFPKHIVAISDTGIKNLTDYFGVAPENIIKIHNCVRENGPYQPGTRRFDPDNVTVLYPARINSIKQQTHIVEYLDGKLDRRVKILFAGVGPQYEELKAMCEKRGNGQFRTLGFCDDVPKLMKDCDFVMLYSEHEGLPISLIEAVQNGVPVICNGVGGIPEIITDGKEGIMVSDWDSLLRGLNSLPGLKQDDIDAMSACGRETYDRRFNFEIFKQRYCELIRKITNA